jgi:capsular polysaccharide biosynthesis protein
MQHLGASGFDGVEARQARRDFSAMASTPTMVSSMIKPMAAAMPPSVIRLKLMPKANITMMAASTQIGMTRMAVNTLPQFLRKR